MPRAAEPEDSSKEIRVSLLPPFPWQRKLRHLVLETEARFILAVMGRRAGKTTACADVTGRGMLRHHQDQFWGAPTYDLASIGRGKLQRSFGKVITKSDNQHPRDDFLGGGSVYWRSFDRPGGALGRGFKLAVVDEAARVKQQVIYEDLLATVADTGGKILAITTPRGAKNWTHEWYQKAVSGNPLYATIRGPSSENPSRHVRDFVRIAQENMPEKLYRQEILGEFIEDEGQVFRKIAVARRLERYLPGPPSKDAQYVVGCDLAKHQDWTVLYAMHRLTGEVHGAMRFQHMDWPLVEVRIVDFARHWNGATVFLDSTGIGDVVYDHLAGAGVPVFPVTLTPASKQFLVQGLAIALENEQIAYPPDDVLTSELESYTYAIRPASGRFAYGAPQGLHDDCVMALALAVHGLTHRHLGDRWLDLLARQPAAG